MTYLYISLAVLWFVSGVAVFIWSYTKESDFTSNPVDIVLAILYGVMGPVVVYLIHLLMVAENKKYRVLIRKKCNENKPI